MSTKPFYASALLCALLLGACSSNSSSTTTTTTTSDAATNPDSGSAASTDATTSTMSDADQKMMAPYKDVTQKLITSSETDFSDLKTDKKAGNGFVLNAAYIKQYPCATGVKDTNVASCVVTASADKSAADNGARLIQALIASIDTDMKVDANPPVSPDPTNIKTVYMKSDKHAASIEEYKDGNNFVVQASFAKP